MGVAKGRKEKNPRGEYTGMRKLDMGMGIILKEERLVPEKKI